MCFTSTKSVMALMPLPTSPCGSLGLFHFFVGTSFLFWGTNLGNKLILFLSIEFDFIMINIELDFIAYWLLVNKTSVSSNIPSKLSDVEGWSGLFVGIGTGTDSGSLLCWIIEYTKNVLYFLNYVSPLISC